MSSHFSSKTSSVKRAPRRAAAALGALALLVGVAACTANATVTAGSNSGDCSANANLSCVSGTTGWSCSGSSQPEDANAGLVCSGDGVGNFCCSTSSCNYDSSVACSSGAVGYSCASGAAPPDSQDSSLVCSEPTTANSVDEYCCYTNTITAGSGATCEQDQTVTGCQPNGAGDPSFGFSCTGTDSPQDDFSGITCSTSGTPGQNAQNQDATLFCCVYN